MTVRELIGMLEDVEEGNAEILIETQDNIVTEVSLIEDEISDDEGNTQCLYKLVAEEYLQNHISQLLQGGRKPSFFDIKLQCRS